MTDGFLDIDTRTQIPRLCNYEMLRNRIGSTVRVVGRIISIDKNNLVIQTPDGAKVLCALNQQSNFQTMQVVEIYAVVLLDTRQRGNTIYLQQYGQMHKWDDSTNMEHLNAAIVLTNHPRIAKYLKYPGDHTAAYQ